MTQTTTPIQPSPEAATGPNIRSRPSEVLMNLIATLMAPVFLCVTGGDIGIARMAAMETVNAYRPRDLVDLLAVAQIVGYGLAALSSLSQSMDEGASLSMILRLRGNAIALNRAAEQNRRVIRENRCDDPAPYLETMAVGSEIPATIAQDDDRTSAEPFLNEAAARLLAGEARARLSGVEPKATQTPVVRPAPVPASTVAPKDAEKRHQEMWAIAMVKEASEITAGIPGLPPAERSAASIRAGMLSSTANQLLTGMHAYAPPSGTMGAGQPPQGFPPT